MNSRFFNIAFTLLGAIICATPSMAMEPRVDSPDDPGAIARAGSASVPDGSLVGDFVPDESVRFQNLSPQELEEKERALMREIATWMTPQQLAEKVSLKRPEIKESFMKGHLRPGDMIQILEEEIRERRAREEKELEELKREINFQMINLYDLEAVLGINITLFNSIDEMSRHQRRLVAPSSGISIEECIEEQVETD